MIDEHDAVEEEKEKKSAKLGALFLWL